MCIMNLTFITELIEFIFYFNLVQIHQVTILVFQGLL